VGDEDGGEYIGLMKGCTTVSNGTFQLAAADLPSLFVTVNRGLPPAAAVLIACSTLFDTLENALAPNALNPPMIAGVLSAPAATTIAGSGDSELLSDDWTGDDRLAVSESSPVTNCRFVDSTVSFPVRNATSKLLFAFLSAPVLVVSSSPVPILIFSSIYLFFFFL
jgi:hypothetical protein